MCFCLSFLVASLCQPICTLRQIHGNKLSGSFNALGKLTTLDKLCVRAGLEDILVYELYMTSACCFAVALHSFGYGHPQID